MDVDLGDVRCFLALVETGHFGRAAAVVHLSPSALSRRLHRLERTVGESLLVRDAVGTHALTAAGRSFADRAPALLVMTAAAVQEARSRGSGRGIRLGLPGAPLAPPVDPMYARVLRELRRLSPSTELHLIGVPFGEMWSCLRSDTVDVVLNGCPSPDLRTVSEPLVPLTRVGLVGLSHPLAGAGAVDAATFAELDLIDDPSLPRHWAELWWLGDLRPRSEARIVELDVPSIRAALHELARGTVATVTQGSYGRIPGDYALVELTNAPPVWHYADHRRGDRRPEVAAVVAALRAAMTPD